MIGANGGPRLNRDHVIGNSPPGLDLVQVYINISQVAQQWGSCVDLMEVSYIDVLGVLGVEF